MSNHHAIVSHYERSANTEYVSGPAEDGYIKDQADHSTLQR